MNRRDKIVASSAVGALILVGAFGTMAVASQVDLTPGNRGPAQIAPVQLNWTETPAAGVLKDILKDRDGWQSASEIQSLAPNALPATCFATLTGPAGAAARSYTIEDTDVQVALQAYSAGQGAAMFDQITAKVKECGGTVNPRTAPGFQAVDLVTRPGGVEVATTMWRRGDVITYVTTRTDRNNIRDLVTNTVDQDLDQRLQGTCVQQQSTAQDAYRSPWPNLPGYTGRLEPQQVQIPDTQLPTVPAGTVADGGAPVVETPIPASEVPVPDITLPKKPSNYPVWPELPAQQAKPQLPNAPVKPSNVGQINVQVADPQGPGCGWMFTSTQAPTFDAQAAEKRRQGDETNTKTDLTNQGKTWQNQVVTYWKDYANYTTSVNAYNTYAQQVQEVAAAWDGIKQQWDAYNAELKEYKQQVAARDAFIKRQNAAQDDYEAGIAACQAGPKTITVTPKPTPTVTSVPAPVYDESGAPTGETTPSPTTVTPDPTPTTRVVPAPVCPAKPSILSQSPPGVGNAPSKPADPRPVELQNRPY